MDILSLFGLVVAVAGILGGQFLEGGAIDVLLQLAAFLIVFGGTLGAVMVQCEAKVFFMAIRMGRWALTRRSAAASMAALAFSPENLMAPLRRWSPWTSAE